MSETHLIKRKPIISSYWINEYWLKSNYSVRPFLWGPLVLDLPCLKVVCVTVFLQEHCTLEGIPFLLVAEYPVANHSSSDLSEMLFSNVSLKNRVVL